MELRSKAVRLGLGLAAQFQGPLKAYRLFAEAAKGKRGLEIGGPSKPFRQNPIPIYNLLESLDNCNFSSSTIWSEHAGEFRYSSKRPPGKNFIVDGTDLSSIRDHYDLVLSSHNLEHIANPVKALKEWSRIASTLILVVPDSTRTFDRFRPITSIEHMLSDYTRDITEDDPTHFEEILRFHDLAWGWRTGTRPELERSIKDNFKIRSVHHHVFDSQNIRELLERCGAEVKVVERALPHHICVLAVYPQ